MTTTPTDVNAWVGQTETVHDALAETQAQSAAAMLDEASSSLVAGAHLPRLWHWFYFRPKALQSALDRDGHPARGGFLPPITLPRRMFAGARVQWHAPLVVGEPASRHGEILSVTHKEGKSGRLAFVTVRYQVTQESVLCVDEEQDIVYREPGSPVDAPDVRAWSAVGDNVTTRALHPDSRLLFRFSALTFNAHRIHYDREYASAAEGYPGLVVHGPLMALLLLRFAEAEDSVAPRREPQPGQRAVIANGPRGVTAFSFRGLAPAFDTGPLRLRRTRTAASVALEAERCDGVIAVQAEAQFG